MEYRNKIHYKLQNKLLLCNLSESFFPCKTIYSHGQTLFSSKNGHNNASLAKLF